MADDRQGDNPSCVDFSVIIHQSLLIPRFRLAEDDDEGGAESGNDEIQTSPKSHGRMVAGHHTADARRPHENHEPSFMMLLIRRRAAGRTIGSRSMRRFSMKGETPLAIDSHNNMS